MTDQSADAAAPGFPTVRRGFDPVAVLAHLRELDDGHRRELEQAAADLDEVRAELGEARQREESVHLTLVAATKTKDDMLEAAARQLEDARAVARQESERIIGEARYEAFRIVSEARHEAEQALLDALGQDAASVPATSRPSGGREGVGSDEPEERRRMERMRTAADDIEWRLHRLAGDALVELAAVKEAIRVETGGVDDLAGVVPWGDFDDPHTDPDRPLTGHGMTPATRGSFYSRRSANLPRIGAEAHDALEAVSAVRIPGRNGNEEDPAMQSA